MTETRKIESPKTRGRNLALLGGLLLLLLLVGAANPGTIAPTVMAVLGLIGAGLVVAGAVIYNLRS